MNIKLPWRITKFTVTFIALALLLTTGLFPTNKNIFPVANADKGTGQEPQKVSRAQALYRQQIPEKPDNFVEGSSPQNNFDEQRSFVPSDQGSTNDLTQVFSNTASINIPTSGVATPYPSTVSVSGFTGNTTKVTVTLTNFSHTFPSDVDVLLVSPTGQKVTILSDVGDINPITNVTLILDDAAVNSLPVVGTIVSGTFKPTDANLAPADVFPSPAPAAPYAMTLSTFNGFSPNGTWSLYVVDQFAGDSGSFAGGFSLSITDDAAAPPPPPPTNATLSFTNNGIITVPGTPGATVGIASPYPATVNVSGFSGNTVKATLTLTNFNHTFPDDVDILLVSPTGQKVIVLSDVGGSLDVVNVTLTLDDAAANSLPDIAQLVSGTFKPTNIGTGDTFAAPAPAAPYGTLLSDFNGVDPNGIWSLYAVDDLGGDAGNFAGGFTLTITAPVVAAGATVQFSSATYSVNENGGSAMITVTRSGSTTGTSTVSYTTSNGTAISGSDYTTATGTLTFPAGSTSQTFMVPIINDNLTEPDETVNLALSAPTGATLGTPSTAVLTIANDDRLDHTTVYGVDTNNNRIQRSTDNGTSWTTVGFGAGVGLGQFNRPKGVSTSLNDMIIFVADTGNNRIQRSTNGGTSWQLLAGLGIGIGQVNAPQSVAYDERTDRLYIADTANNRIQVINAASTANPVPSLFAGSSAGTALGQFNQPRGVAVDGNGVVYVADTLNNRIQQNVSGLANGWTILVNATAGTVAGKFNQPRGIYANGAGDVYVADTLNNRIQKLSGGIWSVFMSTGATLGTVNAPEGVVTTSTNFVFVGDTANNRVQRLTSAGTSPTVVGPVGLAVGQFNQVSGMR